MMRLPITTSALLLYCLSASDARTTKVKRNLQDSGTPSFRRDAVEYMPKYPGDQFLPYTKKAKFGEYRLPLRDAVESIPHSLDYSRRLAIQDAVQQRDYLKQSNVNAYYLYPQNLQTFYSPFNNFHGILSEYRAFTPYRSENVDRQQPNVNVKNSFVINHSISGKNSENDGRIICYINDAASYRREPLSFNPEDLDPFLCTHVIYNYATIDPTSYTIISNNENYDVIQGGYKAVTYLREKNPSLKVLISLGGSEQDGSRHFSNMVSNITKRFNFIHSVISFIEKYSFDGLEIHWEYPGTENSGGQAKDKKFFGIFLEEISEIFKSNNWILAVSAPASKFKIEDGFDPSKLADIVDFVNLKTYDFHLERELIADHPSNLFTRPEDCGVNKYLSVDYAVQFWLSNGFPKSKLILGIPFYGRSFTLRYLNETEIGSPVRGPGKEGYYTNSPGILAYFEICEVIMNGGWFQKVDGSGSPFVVNGDQWIGFDGSESIKQKVNYVKKYQLGGVAVNAADMDDFKGICGTKWPLLTTINSELRGINSGILAETQIFPTKPSGVCDSPGYFSDPSNCAAYYICKNSLLYHMSCDKGLMFNPTNAYCDEINTEYCRPGETVYFPTNLKDLDVPLKRENIIDDRPKVVCYVTNWSFYRKGDGKFVPEQVDQTLCTHVVYAFASLNPETLLINEFDTWGDLENNLYERITSLKDTTVLLSLGGWTDSTGDKYSRLVSDGSARRRFVVGVVGFLRKYKFKGLHFDWNYPTCWQSNCQRGPSSDKANFVKIIQELRKEFNKQSPPLILAAAISGYKEVIDLAYDLPQLGENLEFLSVMTYDYHGSWERQTGHVSPLYGNPSDKYPQYNVNFTMEYLVSKGAPRNKLLLGIPFYGQSFELTNKNNYGEHSPANGPGEPGEFTKQPGMLAYYEICHRIKNERWTVNRNNIGRGPYAYNKDQWVGYEDINSVKEKASYIKSRGFGGAVSWTIDLDDFNNKCCEGTFPLLKTLNYELGLINKKPSKADCTKPPPPSTPAPPETTIGVDSGASSEHHHNHSEQKPTSTTASSTTKRSSTTPWWQNTSTTPWWNTTTKKPTAGTTSPWWTSTNPTTSKTTTKRPVEPVRPPGGPIVIPPPVITRPEIEKPAKTCEPHEYLPDKMNCNAFYRCIAGELRKQYCAGGLHWNREKHICDWPSEAKCKEENNYQKPTPTKKPTTIIQPTTTTWKPVTAPVLDSCKSGAYYPHELCTHFYVCFNDKLVEQTCAPGLVFNVQNKMCDWSFKVKCVNKTKLTQNFNLAHESFVGKSPQAYSACEGNSFAPLPGTCNQYLHCQWGKYEIRSCAPGLHWNNEGKLCDWPKNAHCKEETDYNEVDSSSESEPKPTRPSERPPVTVQPPQWSSTTQWTPVPTQWTPVTTSESSEENQWEWHPPIPPTSEKPPLSEPLKPLSGYFKIVCYFTNWAWYRQGLGKYLPEDIDENLCTHIVYGFAVLDYSNYVIKAHDSWADFDNQFYKRVVDYKSKGVKVSVAIGGWNDSLGDKYSKLVNNPAARKRFIEHLLKFLDKYNFDGLDLDWEYPKCWQVDCKKGPDSDKPSFAEFVKELKEAFKPKGYLLSSAVSPSKTVIDAGYDVPKIAKYLDWIAVMTYDFHGQWDKQTGHVAPLFYHPEDEVDFFNSNFSIHYWISEGVPRRNIVMGMPLYGQSFQLEKESVNGLNAYAPGPGEAGEYTRAAGFLAYYEICHNIQAKGWTVVQDPLGTMGPYAYKGNQWVSFDDKNMIRKKSEYIRRMDLGGGMIWALDLDDFKNRCGQGRHPLLTIIRNTLADPGIGQQQSIDDL